MSVSTPERTPYDGLRIEGKEQGAPAAEPEYAPELDRRDRVVSVRAILDALSMWFIAAGGGLGVAAAALAGGTVPALATAGGVLIALGLLLTL